MIQEIEVFEEIDGSVPFVVFSESESYPYQLVCYSLDQPGLLKAYPSFLSSYSVLIETGLFDKFVEKLVADGYQVYLFRSSKRVLDKHHEWSEPITIDGLKLPDRDGNLGTLFPYQQYAVRKGLDVDLNTKFLFANHGTGTGKSVTACAIAQELRNRDQLDVVLFFTLRKNKINMMRAFNSFTELKAVNIENNVKAKRAAEFAKENADVYVLNYEKANFDYAILEERIKGKRVLFVFDEVQKILVHGKGNKPNKAGTGIKHLLGVVHKDSVILPMSATAINADPERYHHLFDKVPGGNPLGSLTNYRKNYTKGKEFKRLPWGTEVQYLWDAKKLQEVRHIIAPWTHTIRKSDPGVKEYFKSTTFEPVMIQLSDEDRVLYDIVLEMAAEDEENWGQYYRILRYICNTTESLKHSKSGIAMAIAEIFPELSSKTSAKMETFIEQVNSIRDQEDKVVVFTQYTNLGLFLISDQLKAERINHVVHYGTGMTDKDAQMAQDRFKKDSDVTVFLSSDAGSHGLSFQEARYVINYDTPYSYDLLLQRNDRIDRADSYLDGLTSYAYITENTVEERIWRINEERRKMTEHIQGTKESLDRNEDADLKFLMFG